MLNWFSSLAGPLAGRGFATPKSIVLRITPVATNKIPPNAGKVRVAMYLGGKYTVWNGKQGQHEFAIICRNRKQAEEIAKKINSKDHNGEIELTH